MGNKLSEPIKVGNLTFKNRIMFPPLTTGYEERDGSIGERSLNFYERLAKGGVYSMQSAYKLFRIIMIMIIDQP